MLAVVLLLTGTRLLFGGAVVTNELFSPILWGPSAIPGEYIEYAFHVDTGSATGVQFLNVVGSDGTWVIQDLAILPGEQDIATTGAASQFVSGQSYQTTVTSDPVDSAPAFMGGSARTLGAPVNYLANVTYGLTESGPYQHPSPRPPPPPPPKPGPPPNWSYHADVPFLHQGPAECVPTAYAMSLSWLNLRYSLGFGDPDAIKAALVKAMQTGPTGTSTQHMVGGEQAFAQKAGVELTNVETGGAGFVFNLLTAMQTGRDVELVVDFLSHSGSHAITIVGVVAYSSTEGEITFYDPDNEKKRDNKSKIHIDGTGRIVLDDYDSFVNNAAQEWVPEPATLTLFVSGLILVGVGRIYSVAKRARAALPVQY